MKKLSLVLFCLTLINCSNSDGVIIPTNTTIVFSHNWKGVPMSSSDLNTTIFTNAKNTNLTITRLRYVLSNLKLTNEDGDVFQFSKQQLVDFSKQPDSLKLEIPTGRYTVSFNFGFTDADNTDGAYPALNTANFNVPTMLGGGYHYMQLDGKYFNDQNTEQPFNYHAIRAVNRTNPENLIFSDTSFEVKSSQLFLGDNPIITVNMDISEWFTNPNLWDLNQLNTVLMPNFDAQLLISANGKSVFSITK